MERLTKWVDNGDEVYAVENPDIRNNGARNCLKKLAELEDAEQENRLVEFPVAIGDSIYEIFSLNSGGGIVEWQVDGYRKTNQEYSILCHRKTDQKPYFTYELGVCRIGTSLFTSRDEAEKKLKG